MRVFFAPLRVFCATLRVIFAHWRVLLAELPRSCLLSVGVFQTVKGTSKVIVGTPVEIERMLFPGRAGRPTSCAKRAFRGAVVRRRQPQGRRHPRPYPLDSVKAVPPPLPTPIYRWEGVVGVGVGMSRRHPNARTPRHFPRQFVWRFWFNTRICSRLTTLTFRGHENLPRKPAQGAAKMV